MSTVNVKFPTSVDKVPTGQNGVIKADFVDSLSLFHTVDFSILDDKNVVVWKGSGQISGSEVIANVVWPWAPGQYTVKAECLGLFGTSIAENVTPFEVVVL